MSRLVLNEFLKKKGYPELKYSSLKDIARYLSIQKINDDGIAVIGDIIKTMNSKK